MVAARNSRADVVAAAGRLFAEKGYHGTSMRELGREVGLLGSSLYAHFDSKQALLVEVVAAGAAMFQEAADAAMQIDGDAQQRLCALIAGHVGVVLDNLDVARTFLNEARVLDGEHRARVIAARDHYEKGFREVIALGIGEGRFRSDLDPKTASIFILSVLNAVERWYRPDGRLNRPGLIDELTRFALRALAWQPAGQPPS
jgi:TetR/AcrR family transcriptional regulator, cholesterol catabolism regulator